tara:strand:- start:305 stop:547 length:243 start_codon:yes stop_codon:yes gene_type:complete
MVQAMIKISKEANQILNIVKAKNNLKDKSEAIEKVVLDYSEEILEPALKPEYIKKLQKIKKQKGMQFKTIDELRRSIENA